MVELILSVVVGFLIGMPCGAFLLVGWVNRYTKLQAKQAQDSLDKLTTVLQQANAMQGEIRTN